MIVTKPAIPRAMRRSPTLVGVAPCANRPAVVWANKAGTCYRTQRQVDRDSRVREAVVCDIVVRRK